jgi:DNA-binding NarL/FixJ family response regulator
MALKKNLKVAVVDDHEFYRQGLIITLGRIENVEVILEAADGEEFLSKVDSSNVPDVVFMDISMPRMGGVEATIKALEKFPELNIIALSMFDEPEYVESMLEAGANGFIVKSVDKDGLQTALNFIEQGKPYFSEEIVPLLTQKIQGKNNQKANKINLSAREFDVLKRLSEGKLNHEIADEMAISPKTVSNYRASLIQKTNTKNTAHLVAYALRVGLLSQ